MRARLRQAGLWALALAPLEWLGLAGSLALRVRVSLGRWPRPYDPDPADVGLWHYRIVQLGVPLMFSATAVAAVIIAARYAVRDRGPMPRLSLVVLAVCLCGLLLLARINPAGFFTWLGD